MLRGDFTEGLTREFALMSALDRLQSEKKRTEEIIDKFFHKLNKISEIEYDYEINHCKLLNGVIYCARPFENTSLLVEMDFPEIDDMMNIEIQDGKNESSRSKANCIKRLVSKKKRRLQNGMFDLDLAYITKRVIAMGFPSSGYESLYRNSTGDVINFLKYYHSDGFKIYNLCIEKGRVYPKSYLFSGMQDKCKMKLSLFPFKDHNPPPIKLILEFCVDISIYLTLNRNAVAAVHCKAGKGRTGTMIVSYLIFSGQCNTIHEAMNHYAKMRTSNNKGVTIPSQLRYIHYFEMFLDMNFQRPYAKMIPKIIKSEFLNSLSSNNMIKNYIKDQSYFFSPNKFIITEVRVGPFPTKKEFQMFLWDLELNIVKIRYDVLYDDQTYLKNEPSFFVIFSVNNDKIQPIFSDIKCHIEGCVSFYFWVNLWYSLVSTLNSIISEEGLLEVFQEFGLIKSKSNKVDVNSEMPVKSIQKISKECLKSMTNESKSQSELKEYLREFNSSSNLNVFLSKINQCLSDLKKPLIDSKNLMLKLGKYELDKFEKIKHVEHNFSIDLKYELLEN